MKILSTFFCFLYFSISVLYASDKREVYEPLLTESIEHMTHGRNEQCESMLQDILKNYRLSKKEKQHIYGLLAVNADIAGDYASQYEYLTKKEGRKHPSGEQELAKMLSELPQQVVNRPNRDVSVSYIIDSLFYEEMFAGCEIRVPITINGKEENVLLDNGCAKFCASSETFARECGIRPIGVGGEAVGVASTASVWFGICDSLSLGELTFKNIIFTVIPDQFIDNSVLEINAMMGANIFRLAGEMLFDNKARTITFPAIQHERESNVAIDGDGIHYVEALVDGQALTLQLDLGAAKTSLSANFYKEYEDHIKSNWKAKVSHIGGVGGMIETTVYALDELPINACGGIFIRKGIEVSTEIQPNEDEEYGSIGNDFFLSFDKADLNLQKMHLYVE